MRISLLINRDFYALSAALDLLKCLPDTQIKIFCSDVVGGSSKREHQLQQLEQAECDGFERLLKAQTIRPLIMSLNKPNSTSGLKLLTGSNPDVIVSIRYGQILHRGVIQLPPLGVLNLHSGLLPGYQGVMATFYAMLDGESSMGATLHRIVDSRIDSGPTVSGVELELDYQRTYAANVAQLYPPGVTLIVDAIEQLIHRGRVSSNIARGLASYHTFPQQKELLEFAGQGFKLFSDDDFLELVID